MNRERILELADLIEKQPHVGTCDAAGFNMNRFVHPCGTPCCIAGWATWESLGRPQKIEADDDCLIDEQATQWLGLQDMEAYDLFWMPGNLMLENITPSQAARTLRHLAETGEVVWQLDEAQP